MLYLVYVYNHVAKFWDIYMVQAKNKEEAAEKAKWRLNDETEEGARGYDINDIVLYNY